MYYFSFLFTLHFQHTRGPHSNFFLLKAQESLNFIEAVIFFLCNWRKKKWKQSPNRTVNLKPVSKIQKHISITSLFTRKAQFHHFLHCLQPAVKLIIQTYEVI